MPRRTDVKSFASGGAVFVWLERLCDTCIILALCACAHNRIYLIAPAFILWRFVYEISMQAVTFSTSSVISCFTRHKDTKSVMRVHYIMTVLCILWGIIIGAAWTIAAPYLSKLILGSQAAADDVSGMRNLLFCLCPLWALNFACGAYRGCEIGMRKQNQALRSVFNEQSGRAIGVIILSVLCYFFFHTGKKVMLYLAVLMASIAAAWQLRKYLDSSNGLHQIRGKGTAELEKRLSDAFLPYFGTVISENLWMAVDIAAMAVFNVLGKYSYARYTDLLGIIMVEGIALLQIPLLVSFNVTAGTLPAVEEDYKYHRLDRMERRIDADLSRVLVLIMPIAAFTAFHGNAVWRVLFHETGAYDAYFTALGIEAAVYCFSFETTYILAGMHQEKAAQFYQLFGLIIKAALLYPMYHQWGMISIPLSGIIAFASISFLDLSKIRNKTDISYMKLGITFIRTCLACIAMHGAAAALSYFADIKATDSSYGTALWQFIVMCVCGGAVYYMAGSILRLFPKRRKR